MREKLIQIYADAKVPGDIERGLAKLRCGNCKHWGGIIGGRGKCFAINYSDSAMADGGIWTKPDFFCALFEEKQ